jgi:putative transcriptional regulator
MNSELRELFGRLGPIRAIDQNTSGSVETVHLKRPDLPAVILTISATLSLCKRGITMLKAKRAVEEMLEKGDAVVTVPFVESTEALLAELTEANIITRILRPAPTPDLPGLRESLGLTREQFALRYGLSVENIRNWEDGRREMDSTARSYLTVIAQNPRGIPLPYEAASQA